MNYELKHLLIQIAQLPQRHQNWIYNRLSDTEKKCFEAHQGTALLKKAQRFSKLKVSGFKAPDYTRLPKICSTLKINDPLYIAIILEQGRFDWQEQFLQEEDKDHSIQDLLQHVVGTIKSASKKLVFSQWQSRMDFIDHLEDPHG